LPLSDWVLASEPQLTTPTTIHWPRAGGSADHFQIVRASRRWRNTDCPEPEYAQSSRSAENPARSKRNPLEQSAMEQREKQARKPDDDCLFSNSPLLAAVVGHEVPLRFRVGLPTSRQTGNELPGMH